MILLPGFLYTSRQYQALAADLNSKGHHAGVHRDGCSRAGGPPLRRQLALRMPAGLACASSLLLSALLPSMA